MDRFEFDNSFIYDKNSIELVKILKKGCVWQVVIVMKNRYSLYEYYKDEESAKARQKQVDDWITEKKLKVL